MENLNTPNNDGLLPIGSTIFHDKYVIEKYLASGGFGKTYVATDTSFDEKVAIKEFYVKGVCGRMPDSTEISVTLTENRAAFDAQREKFRKEARRLRSFTRDHANSHIVRVHDLFDDNGTSYYVMDLVDGQSLAQYTKKAGRRMLEDELFRILPQLLDALETIHAEGIWHLDLKPANIMIDRKGDVYLIDFGASKQLHNDNGESLPTSSAMAYTPGYAPYEQLTQSIDKFGPWTDIYALGATLYSLVTLKTPPSPTDIEEDVDEALPFPDDVSQNVRELIKWMMKPNRKMRPQCIDDIRQYLAESGKSKDATSDEKPEEQKDDDIKTEPSNPVKENPSDEEAQVVVEKESEETVATDSHIVNDECDATKVEPKPAMKKLDIDVNGYVFTMIPVEGGTFTMGATSEQSMSAFPDERPAHKVTLDSYWIGETVVTQLLWQSVMGKNPSVHKDSERPVTNVNWTDCQEFIRKLNEITGKKFRLPTEAEWEYAARGGSKSRNYKYSGSNRLGDVGWYSENSANVNSGRGTLERFIFGDEKELKEVKTKAPNELGIYDMSGNVNEWCHDLYDYYSSDSQKNPKGPRHGIMRVTRGGSWNEPPVCCRVSRRKGNIPTHYSKFIGLRLCL